MWKAGRVMFRDDTQLISASRTVVAISRPVPDDELSYSTQRNMRLHGRLGGLKATASRANEAPRPEGRGFILIAPLNHSTLASDP